MENAEQQRQGGRQGLLMGAFRWTPEAVAEFEKKKQQWEKEGKVTTHKIARAGETLNKNSGLKRKNGWLEPLLDKLRVAKIPEPTLEHRFHGERKWRFDLCWPPEKLALEVEGGIWVAGRHSRGKGMEADMEKYAEATILGWSVLRASVGQVKDGTAVEWVKRALDEKKRKYVLNERGGK